MTPEELARLAAEYLATLGIEVAASELLGLATDEAQLGAVAARIAQAGAALAVLGEVEKAIAAGELAASWNAGELPADLVKKGLATAAKGRGSALQSNLRAAYNLGRYERAERSGMPLFVYRTMRDSRVRDSHAKLNGVALPRRDSWWDTHYPPNGPRCRCIAYASDQDGLDALKKGGVPVQETAPSEKLVKHRNKLTGEELELPASVEPGWHYPPREQGRALAAALAERMAALRG